MTTNPPMFTFIVGMHRSGTSALTRLVSASDSLTVGPADGLIGASKTNPHGHFEHEQFTRFNDRLLTACGAHWAIPARATPDRLTDLSSGEFGDEALELLSEMSAEGITLVKDPRLCLTLPFWRALLPAHAAQMIAIFRNPAAVAASLIRRNHLSESHATYVWAHYNLGILRAQRDGLFPSITVNFEQLMDETPEVLKQIELVSKAGQPLDTSLLDHQSPHTADADEVPETCVAIWQTLHASAAGEEPDLGGIEDLARPEPDWQSVASLFARKRDKANAARHAAALKAVDEKTRRQSHESELHSLRKKAAQQQTQLREMESALDKKRKRAAELALALERAQSNPRPPTNSFALRVYRKGRATAAKSAGAKRVYHALKRRLP